MTASSKQPYREFSPKIEVFDKLRSAMRIAEVSGKNGFNDQGMDEDMPAIKEKVTEFRHWRLRGQTGREEGLHWLYGTNRQILG